MTGTLHLTIFGLPQSYAPSSDLLEKLTPFQFSSRLTDYFCSTCGSHVLAYLHHSAQDESSGSSWDVYTGTLENINDIFEVESHDYIGDTLDGGFADFLPAFNDKEVPRFAGRPNASEELPLYWSSSDKPRVEPSPNDRLHCHCKCGGVEFWIARPSERSRKASDQTAWWLRDDGKKFLAGVCSCNSCRLDTGMEFVEWAFVPTIDISTDPDGKKPFKLPFGMLKEYRSNSDVLRYHCSVCGATAFYTNNDRVDLVDVAVGLINAPEGARADTWLEFRTQRLSFREDALPRAKDLTLAVEHGLEQFGKRYQEERSKPLV